MARAGCGYAGRADVSRMYPGQFPALEAADPSRDAERLVYERCDQQLAADYSVLYSVAWLQKDRAGRAAIGEADFCVVHERLGILIVEVKGGGIARDAATGQWTSTSRDGRQHPIKDPGAQARRSMFALKDKLESLPRWRNRRVQIGYAVVFPNVDVADAITLPPDLPTDIVVSGSELKWLDRKIESVFEYWRRETDGRCEISPDLANDVVELLSPTFELRATLGAQIEADSARLIQLSEQQAQAFSMFRRVSRVGVRGVAGSGKTVIALEQARRLANEGFRTLLTCFNRRLADDLREQATGIDGLVCDTFHGFCEDMAMKAGVELPTYGPTDAPPEYFNEMLPAALEEALTKLPDERFDAILVDEGQDFHADWLALLELAQTTEHEGVFFMFYDKMQGIYRRDFEPPSDMVEIVFDANLRNTRTIHEFAMGAHEWDQAEARGPEGRPVELIAAENPKGVERELSRVLHRLVREEGVATSDIAVLSGRARGHSSLAGVERVGAFLLGVDGASGAEVITFDSIHRFKGLERPVIVLIDVGAVIEERPALAYVGITRALSHLVVIDSEETLLRLARPVDDSVHLTKSADAGG